MARTAPRGGSDGRDEHFTTYKEWRRKWANATGISHATARVMERMVDRATWTTGEDIRPSTARIAHETGISTSHIQGVKGHIGKLQTAGWLILVTPHTTSTPAVYRLGIGEYGPEYVPQGPPISEGTPTDDNDGVLPSEEEGPPVSGSTVLPSEEEGPPVSGSQPSLYLPLTSPKTSSSPSSPNSPAEAASPEPREVAPGTTSPTRVEPTNDDDAPEAEQPTDLFQQLLAIWPNPRAKTRGSIPLAADEWATTLKTHQPHTLLTAARAGIANRSITTSTFINAWLRDYTATVAYTQPVFVCAVCRDRGFVGESWSVDGQPVKQYRVACPACATRPAPGVTVCVRPEHAKGSLELAMSA